MIDIFGHPSKVPGDVTDPQDWDGGAICGKKTVSEAHPNGEQLDAWGLALVTASVFGPEGRTHRGTRPLPWDPHLAAVQTRPL